MGALDFDIDKPINTATQTIGANTQQTGYNVINLALWGGLDTDFAILFDYKQLLTP